VSIADKIASSVVMVEAFIANESQRMAALSAQEIGRMSGGAIVPTTEQLAALKAKAADDLEKVFAEQVASIANTFTVNKW